MDNLKVSEIQCINCKEQFVKKVDLDKHIKAKHSIQWNCEQCDFQASTRTILMNHCKLTKGHQPSTQTQRLGQTGVIECYTCRSEFRSYHNLMSHRKNEHPSHKKCRYFLKGECKFSKDDCWCLHEERATTDNNVVMNFKCNLCKNLFMSNHDLMEHNKINHPMQVPTLNSSQSHCDRSTDESLNQHSSKTTSTTHTNPTTNAWAKPLSSAQKKDFCQHPPATAPDQGELLNALQLLNKRLQAIETRMFPEQH